MSSRILSRVNDVELEQLLINLVKIPSVTPSFATGGEPNEVGVVKFLGETLREYGFDVEEQTVDGERCNLIARVLGRGEKTLVMNGHLDTVSGANMSNAFASTIEGNRLYGRGASDMKGGIAAMVEAAKTIKDSKVTLDGDLVLSLVIDEEATGNGTRKFIEKEKCDYAIIGEPTQNQIGLAQAGWIGFNIESEGQIQHGSTLKLGDNASALVNQVKILSRILELPSVQKVRRYAYFDMPNTVNFCMRKHRAHSSYAWMTVDYCEVEVLIGAAPGETSTASDQIIEEIVTDVKGIINESNKAGQSNQIPRIGSHHGFIQPRNEFIERFEQAVYEVQGIYTQAYFISFCDAAYFFDAGKPTLIYGPGRLELGHSTNEHVDLNQVKEAARTYVQAALNILGTKN